jgi:aldehyde dehydrogenase (NAD+)
MMPFGGTKFSGIGRESWIDAVREYLETKSVWVSTATDVSANLFVMR